MAADEEWTEPRPRRLTWGPLTSAMTLLRGGGGTLLDTIFPPLCLSCEARVADHDSLCPACWRQIDFIRPPLCDRLGMPLPFDAGPNAVSAAALADPPVYDRARAAAVFDGPMRALIHRLKYADRHDGRRLFGRWLVAAGQDLIDDCHVIVPIPLSRLRLLTRRFNQAQILAQSVAKLSGKPVEPLALRRRHGRAHQAGLSRNERLRNVSGMFSVAPHAVATISGRRIVLIDDVITTGATVSAATRALRTAGAARVDVLALALTLNH